MEVQTICRLVHWAWFLGLFVVNGDDCKPPNGYSVISPGSKFLWKNITDRKGHFGKGPPGFLKEFETLCHSEKLEPWIPRSNADMTSHKEFTEYLVKVFGSGSTYNWPFGVIYLKGRFYASDNKTLLEEGDWESNTKIWDRFSASSKDPYANASLCLYQTTTWIPPKKTVLDGYNTYSDECYKTYLAWNMQLCQWPKGSDCYKNSKEEKLLAAENEGPNKFIHVGDTHSGNIFIAKRLRTFPGARQLCAEGGMRLIAWNELDFKGGDVPLAVVKYRSTQATPYPFLFWVEMDNTLPTPHTGISSTKPEDRDWDRDCWGLLPKVEASKDGINSTFIQIKCRLPNNVVCIKEPC